MQLIQVQLTVTLFSSVMEEDFLITEITFRLPSWDCEINLFMDEDHFRKI